MSHRAMPVLCETGRKTLTGCSIDVWRVWTPYPGPHINSRHYASKEQAQRAADRINQKRAPVIALAEPASDNDALAQAAGRLFDDVAALPLFSGTPYRGQFDDFRPAPAPTESQGNLL